MLATLRSSISCSRPLVMLPGSFGCEPPKREPLLAYRLPLAEGPLGYQIFNDKQDGCVKVVLKPGLAAAPAGAV